MSSQVMVAESALHLHHIEFYQVEARGGCCIPVQCDHSNEEETKALFERIEREQNGQLDVLVNNAYAAVPVSQPPYCTAEVRL